MAAYTNFDYDKKSIKEWLNSYEEGIFSCESKESISAAGWLMWEKPEALKSHIIELYKMIKMVSETNKLNVDETFIRLKEVPQFGREDYNYANVIFYQELNNLPLLVITPNYKGKSELFLINNKHKVVGTFDDIKEYLTNKY